MKIFEQTMKNGMNIIVVPRDDTAVVTVMAGFKVGSRDEDDKIAGISHFLEHMAYKGTKKRPTSRDVAKFIEDLGGRHNAFTAKDHTGYYVKLSSDHLEDAMDFISDMIVNATLPEKEVEKERLVILEELKMYEDMPMYLAAEKFEEAVHRDSDLARLIIGTRETVSKISREDIFEYKQKFYNAKNACLIIAGNLAGRSDEEVVTLATKYFRLAESHQSISNDYRTKKIQKVVTVNKKTEQSNIVIGFPSCGVDHPDYYAVKILAKILGGSMSSRMWDHVREELCLAYEIETGFQGFLREGYIVTYAGVAHHNVAKATEAIVKEYYNIANSEVSDDELKRAKEIIKGRLLIDSEDSGNIAHDFLYDKLITGKIVPYDEELKNYQKITKDDITEVARKYLVSENLVFSGVGSKMSDEVILKAINNIKSI